MSLIEPLRQIIWDGLPQILSVRSQRNTKEDGSYVTAGDLLVNQWVFEYLEQLPTRYSLVSEESPFPNVDVNKGGILVLDPIDGTENFTSGLPLWGICICFFENGRHLESGLLFPELNRWLITGQSIQRQESRIRGLSSSFHSDENLEIEPGAEYRLFGSSAYNLYSTVMGCFHSYQNTRGAHSWDILPGINLALEHGLNVKVDDQPYQGDYLGPHDKYRVAIDRQSS